MALFRIRLKQPISAVYPLGFIDHSQCDDFQVEEGGNRTGRQMFPFAVTKSLENCLHISKNLTNFVYKLHIIIYITYELDILSYLAAVIYTTFLSALF